MSEKVRIYQLAKELDLESKDLLPILDDMGVAYKTASSTLDSETAETIRQLVKDEGVAKPKLRQRLKSLVTPKQPSQPRPSRNQVPSPSPTRTHRCVRPS